MRKLLFIFLPLLASAQSGLFYPNAGATGTTLNKLAKLTGAPSTAVITATSDVSGAIGIVVAGAGTTGTAVVAYLGKALCVFDGATTAGDFVVISNATAGNCADGGTALPTNGQVIGKVTTTNVGAGTYEVDLSFGRFSVPPPTSIGAIFNGGGSALTSGTTVGSSLVYTAPLTHSCTVRYWTVTVDGGTAGFRVWRKAAGTAVPTVSDTLNGGDLAIASGTNLRSTTMTNFTGGTAPSLVAGDILAFQLNAAATATYAAVSLICQ